MHNMFFKFSQQAATLDYFPMRYVKLALLKNLIEMIGGKNNSNLNNQIL